MHSTHTGQLDIPALPPEAKTAHIFSELASGSLLSIGQLCDHGCSAYFDKAKLYILYKGNIIMQGSRGPTKLWTIDQPATTVHALNSVIDAPTIAERLKFYTASLFLPTLTTLAKAITAGFLTTFPTFTTRHLRRYPPQLTATPMGHLNAQRSNQRSTK